MLLSSLAMGLDVSSAVRGFNALDVHVIERIRVGLTLAGTKFMQDTVTGLPTTPIKRPGYPPQSNRTPGGLRGSGAVFVDKAKMASSAASGIPQFQPEVYGGTFIPKNSHEACVVFNAPYAALQHESFPIKTEKTAGTHYMSEKLYGNAVEYIRIIAEAVRL